MKKSNRPAAGESAPPRACNCVTNGDPELRLAEHGSERRREIGAVTNISSSNRCSAASSNVFIWLSRIVSMATRSRCQI